MKQQRIFYLYTNFKIITLMRSIRELP